MRKMSAIGSGTAATLASLALLAGCGSESADASPEQSEAGAAGGFDRCTLLTDEEVALAVGAHDGGKRELGNTWGLGSCRWKANAVYALEGWPEGRSEAIEVALFDEDFVETWARGEAEGEPVAGVVDGAVYDRTAGQLWFDCAGDRFCVVDASTRSSEEREEIAVRFARLVESRLR